MEPPGPWAAESGCLASPLLLCRSFTHFLTGVCAIIGGMFTGESQGACVGRGCPGFPVLWTGQGFLC